MKDSGLFSLEALACFTILCTVAIAALSIDYRNDASEIFLLQKMNDLLTIWAREDYTENEMVHDAAAMFPGKSFEIETRGKKFGKGKVENALAKEIIVFSGGSHSKILLTVQR